MTTLTLGRDMTRRVRTRAARIDPTAVALALVALVPYLLGWTVRQICRAVWAAIAHLVAAGIEGWQDGGRRRDGDT